MADPPRFERHEVRNLYSIAHLFPTTRRCGVYVLWFSNGERYVGQTVNVVTRFGTHRRRWSDIDYLLFARAPRGDLNELELQVIRGQRSMGYRLRNITHSDGPLGDSDLDPTVTPAEQYAWLNREGDIGDVEVRADDSAQRRKYRAKYRELRKSPYFPFVALAVNFYVQGTIPKPRETERTFWSLSALPSTNRNRHGGRLATISINKMETLFLFGLKPELGTYVGGKMNVSLSSLEESAGSLSELRRTYPNLEFEVASYEAAGGDALTIGFVAGALLEVMQIPGCQQAARRLNLMLMRKGPTFQWRWHCYDLADWAVRPELTMPEIEDLFAGRLTVPR